MHCFDVQNVLFLGGWAEASSVAWTLDILPAGLKYKYSNIFYRKNMKFVNGKIYNFWSSNQWILSGHGSESTFT
jgi:hypothetical protein